MMRRLVLLAALLTLSRSSSADVQRFAVIVGNNRGSGEDQRLRYAEADAEKIATVLRDLGGFQPANIVVLRDEDAAVFRTTLIAMNDRIRAVEALPDTQTVLFVYYSGHANASALHMGSSAFAVSELGQLVRGSSATFRILLLDACRSGALTRAKGGKVVGAFALPGEPTLKGEGLAFLTATSANEDAQESDELRGSFFTHAFVSGLLGAADRDADGVVVLEEAYRYAYETTLRATSRTFAGVQHPTFRYDFRGQDAVALTSPGARAVSRVSLRFPAGAAFMLFRDSGDGAVVGEVDAYASARTLSLRPGRYFVRGRAPDVLLEGTVDLAPGEARELDVGTLRRVEYARLVRKGSSSRTFAHGPELGVSARTQLSNADRPCFGATVGYGFDFEHFGILARLGACRSGFTNGTLEATSDEYDLSLVALHTWDLPVVSLSFGVGGGAAFFHQSFETSGRAPDRNTLSPTVLAAAGAKVDLPAGFFTALDVRAETHFIDLQSTSQTESSLDVSFAIRGTFVIGHQF